jgi:hypothetical protein
MISLINSTKEEFNSTIKFLLSQDINFSVSICNPDFSDILLFGKITSHSSNSITTELTENNFITSNKIVFVEETQDYYLHTDSEYSLFQFNPKKHILCFTPKTKQCFDIF